MSQREICILQRLGESRVEPVGTMKTIQLQNDPLLNLSWTQTHDKTEIDRSGKLLISESQKGAK